MSLIHEAFDRSERQSRGSIVYETALKLTGELPALQEPKKGFLGRTRTKTTNPTGFTTKYKQDGKEIPVAVIKDFIDPFHGDLHFVIGETPVDLRDAMVVVEPTGRMRTWWHPVEVLDQGKVKEVERIIDQIKSKEKPLEPIYSIAYGSPETLR